MRKTPYSLEVYESLKAKSVGSGLYGELDRCSDSFILLK